MKTTSLDDFFGETFSERFLADAAAEYTRAQDAGRAMVSASCPCGYCAGRSDVALPGCPCRRCRVDLGGEPASFVVDLPGDDDDEAAP